MHYAAIAPTRVLESNYLAGRPVHFCLAQQYFKDEKYAAWYKERTNENRIANTGPVLPGTTRTVILDNGAWEKELLEFARLRSVIDDLKPEVVVLPDVMHDKKMTKYLHSAFRAFYVPRGYPLFMDVLQGYDIWDYLETYIASTAPWIGFPRCMNDHNEWLRVQVAERLQALGMWKKDVKHHALGMNDGDLMECEKLAKLGFYSIDSSNPIWRRAMKKDGDIDLSANVYVSDGHLSYALKEVDDACSGGK